MATHPEPARLLEPRFGARWEWPDLGMKVFLAAQLTEAGTDVRSQLRRMMWPPFRSQHIGFVAALVRHGAEVDGKMLRRAVRLLARTVRSASTGKEWLQHVQWLHEIDAGATTKVLRSMVARPGRHTPNRRFETIRYLIGMDPYENAESVVTYLLDPEIRRIDRNGVDKLLADIDVELSVRIFSELATEAHEPTLRLQGSEIVLSHDTDRGLELLARIGLHSSTSDDTRIAAINIAAGHDEAFGFELWRAFTATASPEGSLAPTTGKLLRARDDRTIPPAQRHEFADFLVHRAGRDPKLLLETAQHHEVPAGQRIEAALLNSVTDPEGSIKIMEDVIDCCQPGDSWVLSCIWHLQQISESKGVEALVRVVKDERRTEYLRLRAAERLPLLERLDMYDYLVDETSFSDDDKMQAARRALHLQRSRGLDAYARIAGQSQVGMQNRMRAARRSEGYKYGAYESIVKDRSAPGTLRVQAAVAARRGVDTIETRWLLEYLVQEELDGKTQLAIAEELDSTDAVRLLDQMACSTLPAKFRLAAAAQLVTLRGVWHAADAYQAIADDMSVSSYQRLEAQQEADQLRQL
ncbi:hypothetical protein FXN61_32970 [Lentzea sp. PSKA42]|uniref:HEAT repeat-containing protein n=1 Tax=Lentzea indica TaxID=2604800 RepID=A0ABX1FS47_9PSEU|nr:hypothetical protein [Lentzea indica]NKE61321.1 hypothetical protein [Lentzea indica]